MSSGARIEGGRRGLAGARTRGSASLPNSMEFGHCASRSKARFAGSKSPVGNRCCGSAACHLALEVKAAPGLGRRPDARQRIPTELNGVWALRKPFEGSPCRLEIPGREPLLRVRGMSSGARIEGGARGLAGARTRGSASLPNSMEFGHCTSRSKARFAGSKSPVGNRCCGSAACHLALELKASPGAWPAPGRAAAHPYRTQWSLGIAQAVRRLALQARNPR